MKKEDPFRENPEDITYRTKWQVLWEWFCKSFSSSTRFTFKHVGIFIVGLISISFLFAVLIAGVWIATSSVGFVVDFFGVSGVYEVAKNVFFILLAVVMGATLLVQTYMLGNSIVNRNSSG